MIGIKNRIFSKKTLYMLCFIALMIIDWTRGSQVGSTWAWTVNMTGVVMALIMFSAYRPEDFRKPVYIIYSIICIAALPLSYYWWQFHQAAIYRDKLLTAVLNVWLLGILLIKTFMDAAVHKIKKISFGKIEILAGIMLLWMLFSKNEDIWPFWYLVMFGLFYHTDYSGKDMEEMREGMLDGIIASFFLLQGAAFVFRPFDSPHGRYNGIYANCNINALFYGVVWVAFLLKLYRLRKNDEKKWKRILCFLFAGALAAFSILTISKTAWVTMFLTGMAYVVVADFNNLQYKAGEVLRKLTLYFIIVVISVPVVYGAVRYIPPMFHHPIWYDGEYSEERVHSWDSWDSEKYVSFSEMMNGISARIIPYLELLGNKINVYAAEPGAAVERNTALDSSNGRLIMWKYYLSGGTFTGHSNTEGHGDELGWYIWHAQNIFVQFWYYYGIPSAVLLLIIIIALIYNSFKRALQKKEGALAALLYLVFFAIFGLFEATWYIGEMILLLAFFTPEFLQETQRGRMKD